MSSIISDVYLDIYQNNKLWMCHNINDGEALFVAKKIEENPNLELLAIVRHNLESTGLTDIGGIAILKALENSKWIHTLSLDGNSAMGDKTASQLANLLKNNSSLTSLSLKNCGLSNEGASIIAEGLKSNTSLKRLLTDDNSIGADGWLKLRCAVSERKVPLNMY